MNGSLPILKSEDMFGVSDSFGNIDHAGQQPLGIFRGDTRFLSHWKLAISAHKLTLVGSKIDGDNSQLTVELASADGGIRVFRSRFLWQATLHERIEIQNRSGSPLNESLVIEFDADFVDIFELRGVKRKGRGHLFPQTKTRSSVAFAYEGLDHHIRRTSILCEPDPTGLELRSLRYDLSLQPNKSFIVNLSVQCDAGSSSVGYGEAAQQLAAELHEKKKNEPEISTANAQFNAWFNRARADLRMMLTRTPHGRYPYAGLPWYNTAFGRDGIITALECLWFDPAVARGVLAFLAATQAKHENPEQDAQSGKILHETRAGEMAAMGEVPFGCYYGSIDATPLFVMLARAYHERTGDTGFIESIWPNIERALFWIDNFADADGDGFYEYASRSPRGLTNQGWKDSPGAIFHQDGTVAEPPIALCEVQAYVFAAKRAGAELARVLKKNSLTETLEREAYALRRRFEEVFWCEELSTYGLALDARKNLCRVRASNAGHCLYAGIASEERARLVAATLMGESSFTGWGIRTVAATEARFDPRSYHNGSVWPHDNAIIAAGFARYGFAPEAERVFSALLDASSFFDLHRLPELFCGFARKSGEAPVPYPVSCSPQTWASCAVFLMLESCPGLKIDNRQVVVTRD